MGVWKTASLLLFCLTSALGDGPHANSNGYREAPPRELHAGASWSLPQVYQPQSAAQSALPLPLQPLTVYAPPSNPILKKNDDFEQPYEPSLSFYQRPSVHHEDAPISSENYDVPQVQEHTYYTPAGEDYAHQGDSSVEDVDHQAGELNSGSSHYGDVSPHHHGHKESKKEVHYHQHKHLHEHDHKQEHIHKHQSHHKHQQHHKHEHHQEHKHAHKEQHGHKHQHGHDHAHKHHHGHKHQVHHQHKHHQEHKHHHHQHHKHQHEHDHKHGHKHQHGHKHAHHHKQEHDHHHNHAHKAHHDHKHKQESGHKHHHKHGHHASHKHSSHHKHQHESVHGKW